MTAGHVLIHVSDRADPHGGRMDGIVARVVRENRVSGLRLERVDVDDDPTKAVELGVMQVPAIVLFCDGIERGRLLGPQSHRAVLHLVLPELHTDLDAALAALRHQLGTDGEQFPRRVLKRHERLGKAARERMLRDVPMFATSTKRQLAPVAAAANEMVLDAGHTLLREGEPGDACFVLAAGSMEVRRRGARVVRIGPGDVVGEMSLIDGEPRTATVTARERCVLLALDRSTFESMLQGSPGLVVAMLAVLAARLRQLDADIIG